MVIQGDTLSRRYFEDEKHLKLIERLAAERFIKPDGDGIAIERNALVERLGSDHLADFVIERKRFMDFEGETFVLDPASVRVANRRVLREAQILRRGKIMDRKGRVLAATITSGQGRARRNYPLGPAALPLLGVAHPVYGLKGLEEALNSYLIGETRESIVSLAFRFLSGKERYNDVVLTIDADLQQFAYDALAGRTGAVVVSDVETGDILAAVSSPSFDPQTPAGRLWDNAVVDNDNNPFVNRAMQKRYPPGSTFKLVTATALLEQEDYDPKWGYECKGRHPTYRIRDYRGKRHGWMNLPQAVKLSCNVFFAEAGVKLGPALADVAGGFGFNRSWTIVEDENPGADHYVLDSRAFEGHGSIREGGAWETIDFERNPRLVAQAAIGQNVIEATPLQMAMVVAALANNGEMMTPRLVHQIHYAEPEGNVPDAWIALEEKNPELAGRVCEKGTARKMMDMLALVMEKGTGHRLKKIYRDGESYKLSGRLPKDKTNQVVGKTGTAESGKGKDDHSWFVAAAPYDDPQFAVAVIVEHGGLGARVAGPVAIDVMYKTLTLEQHAE